MHIFIYRWAWGSHAPKAFRAGERLPPEPKVRHPPRKIVIEKRTKTEFALPLLGIFGENTLHPTPKIQIPSFPSGSLPLGVWPCPCMLINYFPIYLFMYYVIFLHLFPFSLDLSGTRVVYAAFENFVELSDVSLLHFVHTSFFTLCLNPLERHHFLSAEFGQIHMHNFYKSRNMVASSEISIL